MKHDLKTEDRRLNQAMEAERNNALRIEEEIECKRKHNRYLGAAQIMDQINENERVNGLHCSFTLEFDQFSACFSLG